MSTTSSQNPVFRPKPYPYPFPCQGRNDQSHSNGIGKGLGNAFRRPRRKLMKDNILAISKASIRKLARRGGVRRMQSTIYDEARSAIKARLTTIMHRIVLMLESDGPMHEVETLHRQELQKSRKTVTVQDVVFALRALGTTLYGFGWYDSGVVPATTITSKKKSMAAKVAAISKEVVPDKTSTEYRQEENSSSSSSSSSSDSDSDSSSDESSIVG